MLQRKWNTHCFFVCAFHICAQKTERNISPTSTVFPPQLVCQGLLTFIVTSVVNMNGVFVALSHQINPLSCITCATHTCTHTWHGGTTGERCQLAPKVFILFLKVFWTTSQCASAALPFYPPHAKLPSPLGATSVPLCMVVGLKPETRWLPPFFGVTCRHQAANGVREWHTTGHPAWPPTHRGEWGVCVRNTVSNGEHLWPLGCGDRGQW